MKDVGLLLLGWCLLSFAIGVVWICAIEIASAWSRRARRRKRSEGRRGILASEVGELRERRITPGRLHDVPPEELFRAAGVAGGELEERSPGRSERET